MTTHFSGGVSNTQTGDPLYKYGMLDPTKWHTFFNDFDTYTAADWTITTVEAGSGSATEALADADGGVLLITNDDADDDSDFLQLSAETYKFASNKKLFFKARFKVSDATQSDFVMGLQITDTTPLAVTDGVYFQKDDGDANLDFYVTKDSTSTTAAAVSTVVDDTYLEVAFYYDGASEVQYFVGGTKLGTSVTTNLPDDEELTVSFGVQNGAAAAKTMSVDYILVAKER
jgi:hypothetical protein